MESEDDYNLMKKKQSKKKAQNKKKNDYTKKTVFANLEKTSSKIITPKQASTGIPK